MVLLYLHHRCVRSTIEERERERIIERVIENSRPRTGAPHGPRARDGEVVTARLWRARQRAVIALFAEVATALGRDFRFTTRGDGLAARTACTVALHRHAAACTDVRSDVARVCLSRARAQATDTPARARARPDLTDAPARRIGARCFFLLLSSRVCVSRRVMARSRNARVSVQVARWWVESRAARVRLRTSRRSRARSTRRGRASSRFRTRERQNERASRRFRGRLEGARTLANKKSKSSSNNHVFEDDLDRSANTVRAR